MENDTIHVSKIFDWFEEDFAAFGGVMAFIHRYRRELGKNVRLGGFLRYDWGLNYKPWLKRGDRAFEVLSQAMQGTP